jgi:hypothetical protein
VKPNALSGGAASLTLCGSFTLRCLEQLERGARRGSIDNALAALAKGSLS